MYRASTENRGDSRHHAITKDYAFTLDTEGKGANPVDTLLASLCGCVGHYVRDFLREQRIASGGFTIDAEGSATADGSKLSVITLRIDLRDAELDEPKRAALLAYVQRCKVLNTLRAGCEIEMRWGRPARPLAPSAILRAQG